ncbi:hypothetical protein Q9233_013498, partial [Columba guinea]
YGGYRLANGSNTCSGRVELLHGGTWGTPCDYLWDLPAANALCQQLDCGVALLIPGGESFTKGNGSFWNSTFSCKKNGSHLRDCPVHVLGHDECPAGNDARVVCSGCPGDRLVNGITCSGRVEIRHGDMWGSLCRSHWNLQAASVLCRQLNCGYAKSIQTGDHFVDGNRPVWRDAFHCEGTESCLWDCAQVTLGNPSCSVREAATVICSGGESRCDGQLEVSLHGTWSRVLNDDWDIKDAHVVCRQLQCGIAQKAYYLPRSERGVGLVGLRSVQCAGNETQLMLCKTSHTQTIPTGVAEDVGVICSEFLTLRLVDGNDCAGRLEVFYNGTWGSICSNRMSQLIATIVCKHLNCGDGGKIARDFTYGRGSGPTWLDYIECTEQHSSLWQCQSDPWDPHSCDNRAEETHISCTGMTEMTASSTRADPPHHPATERTRISTPVIICIFLGALLCLVLAILAGQIQSARAQQRGSRVSYYPFSEAVYEEINSNLMMEKQGMTGLPGLCITFQRVQKQRYRFIMGTVMKKIVLEQLKEMEDGNPTKKETENQESSGEFLVYYRSLPSCFITGSSATAFSSGRSLPVIANTSTVAEVSPLPGSALEDGYDDVAEAPGPQDTSLSGQNEQEFIGIPEESDRNKDSQTGEARRAMLLVFILCSYCAELRKNRGGGFLKVSTRFYLTTVTKKCCLPTQRLVLPFLFSDWSSNVSGNRTSESERHSSPALENMSYNNIEELGH